MEIDLSLLTSRDRMAYRTLTRRIAHLTRRIEQRTKPIQGKDLDQQELKSLERVLTLAYGAPMPPELTAVRTCTNCGSDRLRWHLITRNQGGVTDGRLRLHEVGVVMALGCEDCSETLQDVNQDTIEQVFNQGRKQRIWKQHSGQNS